MSRSQRRAMIDREEPKLSLVRQCGLLGISRSSLYYLQPRPERGLGLIWPSTTKSGPIKPWAIGHRVRCSKQ